MQGTRSVLQRYTSEFESRSKTENRVGIVIDGEACDIHCVFVLACLQLCDNVKIFNVQ